MGIFNKIITKIKQYNTPKLEEAKERTDVNEEILNIDEPNEYKIEIKDIFKLLHNKADIIITTGKNGDGLYLVIYMSSDKENELGTYIPVAKIDKNRVTEKDEILKAMKSNMISYLFASKSKPQTKLREEFYGYFSPTRCKEKGFKLTPEAIELFTENNGKEIANVKRVIEGIQIPYHLLIKVENKLRGKENANWKEQYSYELPKQSRREQLSNKSSCISREELEEILLNEDENNDLSKLSREDITSIASQKIGLIKKALHSDLDELVKQYEDILYKKMLKKHIEEKGEQAENQIDEFRQIVEKFDIPHMTKEEKIRLFKETFVEINSKDKQKIRTELDNYNDYTKKIEEVQRKPDKTELETLKREKQEFLKKCLKQYINEYILRQDYLIQQYNQIAKENGMKTFDMAGDEEQRS